MPRRAFGAANGGGFLGGASGDSRSGAEYGVWPQFEPENRRAYSARPDRGSRGGKWVIDTAVYYRGRVLHRRTSNYFDLLPLDDDREYALKLRLDEQHRMVIEEIRSGALQLNVSTLVASPGCDAQERPAAAEVAKPPAASPPQRLLLELINGKSWMSGKHARLQILVREESGAPVSSAQVLVEIEGNGNGQVHRAETSPQGLTLIEL